jgi:hypothetical protein
MRGCRCTTMDTMAHMGNYRLVYNNVCPIVLACSESHKVDCGYNITITVRQIQDSTRAWRCSSNKERYEM